MTEVKPLSARGTLVCRGCGKGALKSVLDLGSQPLSNEMAISQASPDPTFPLHLRICRSCGLGQVGEYVLPERIFGAEYPYLSSVSSSWVAHAGHYAQTMQDTLSLGPHDLVMEIASNDGYLLRQVRALGMPVLGIEPADGVAEIARSHGVPTVSEFFGLDLAERLVVERGHPRLVVANNVMAHVPDLDDFVSGLARLCDERTVVTVENPSFLTLLREAQFDTIYHEHFSYLTAHAVTAVIEPLGLELVRVDRLSTHGGSNRYWLMRRGSRGPDDSVRALIEEERFGGLLAPSLWEQFSERSNAAIHGLRAWLDERRDAGRTVAAYGAAAKGNTLLNAVGVHSDDLLLVVDGSEQKQGKFLPGSQVPVVPPARLAECQVDDVLVLPWNLAHEITSLVNALSPEATCWVAVPTMQPVV